VLVAVVGPEADVEVGVVAGAVVRVVVEVAFCARREAADVVVDDPARACFAGAAGGAALVVVDDGSSVVAVDGLAGTGLAVADVVGSAGATAAGSSVPPPPPQPEPTMTRTTPRAARRKRMVTDVSLDRHR
jgi:hypothetical protein